MPGLKVAESLWLAAERSFISIILHPYYIINLFLVEYYHYYYYSLQFTNSYYSYIFIKNKSLLLFFNNTSLGHFHIGNGWLFAAVELMPVS